MTSHTNQKQPQKKWPSAAGGGSSIKAVYFEFMTHINGTINLISYTFIRPFWIHSNRTNAISVCHIYEWLKSHFFKVVSCSLISVYVQHRLDIHEKKRNECCSLGKQQHLKGPLWAVMMAICFTRINCPTEHTPWSKHRLSLDACGMLIVFF